MSIKTRPLKNAQFCSSSRKAKILTTPYDLPDLRGRHEYMEYFEDKAKASLRAKFEPDPREIGFAFHRAGTEIGQKGAFYKGLKFFIRN